MPRDDVVDEREFGTEISHLRRGARSIVAATNAPLSLRSRRSSRCIPIRHEFALELRRLRELHTRVLGRAPGAAGNVFLTPEGKP